MAEPKKPKRAPAKKQAGGRGKSKPHQPKGAAGKARTGAQPTRRHQGKPVLNLHAPIAYVEVPDPNGPGTVRQAQSIIDVAADTFRFYGTWPDAAARCGIHVDTLRGYVDHGARVRRNMLSGDMKAGDLRAHDRQCVELLERIERAQADGALMLTGVLARSAQGHQLPPETKTKRDSAGNVLQVETTVRHAQPDPRSAMWLLERTRPADYGPAHQRVEVTGADGAPLVDVGKPLDRLTSLLDSIRANRAAAPTAADAEAHVTPTPEGTQP